MARKALSKKTRFDVFKRDGFVCQYCGRHPPVVLLAVDHINPVKLGGTNDEGNLVTSCEDCNAGKAAVPLTIAPRPLAERASETIEREAQLAGYASIMDLKRERIEDEAWRIADVLSDGASQKKGFHKPDFLSIKQFIERLGFYEVLEAADIADARKGPPISIYTRWKYFCGVCWKKIRDAEGTK